MDPQDKKSKDFSLFGKAEDRAIAKAKYKREMGINPAYKTEQNAEVSRSAQSMKNPTDRPYDKGTAPIGLKKPPKAAVAETPVAKSGFGPRISEQAKLERLRATRAALNKKPADSPKIPKPTPKPIRTLAVGAASGSSSGAASDKSRVAPKMTNFQRMKARQFEKEGVAGRSMTAAQAKRKATEKGSSVGDLRKLFGIGGQKKPEAKRSGPLKSAFAKISYQGQKKK